jgi:hypothetical protein
MMLGLRADEVCTLKYAILPITIHTNIVWCIASFSMHFDVFDEKEALPERKVLISRRNVSLQFSVPS